MVTARDAMLDCIARAVPAPGGRPALVAVDGADGSGKTWFADALAERMRGSRGVHVVHVDDFHHLRAIRHRRGRTSPEGFFEDSYDYEALRRLVLDPVRTAGRLRSRWTDLDADTLVDEPWSTTIPGEVVLVEGIFLHRDGLAAEWDASVFLDVPFEETARRMAVRDGTPPDPSDPAMRRYVEGQRIYFRECRPWDRASFHVDNTDPDHPVILRHDVGPSRTTAAPAVRLISPDDVGSGGRTGCSARST